MDETNELELTEKQVIADKLVKGVLNVIVGVAATVAVAKVYDTIMTNRRQNAVEDDTTE